MTLNLQKVRRAVASFADSSLRDRFPSIWRFLRHIYWELLLLRHPFVVLEGVRLRVSRAFPIKLRRDLHSGLYEPLEIQALRSTLDESDVAMELGTGIGFLATYLAKKIGSDRVFTYEANPALEPLIRDTFALNGVSPAFQTCLLGESAGESSFFVDADFRASSAVQFDAGEQIRVPMRSFNEELQRIRPTFLIVDIEGGEYDLVQFMNFSGIRKILIEVHENIIGATGLERLKSIILGAGFSIDPRFADTACLFFSRSGSAIAAN
jgi:FkbM family methyltransferase